MGKNLLLRLQQDKRKVVPYEIYTDITNTVPLLHFFFFSEQKHEASTNLVLLNIHKDHSCKRGNGELRN